MSDDFTQRDPHEEFVALYVQHQVAIRSFVRTLLPDAADAEDVMQTTCLTMWRKFEHFQAGTSFRNWGFQIAKFAAMKHVARKARDRRRFSEATMELLAHRVEQQSERLADERQAIAHCIEKLADADRQALAACYAGLATLKEFADQLGRTPNALYKQLGRIRGALVECVQRRLQAEGIA